MRLSALRQINPNTVDKIVGRLRSEALVYVNANKELLYKKVTDLNNWYTRLIGLDEVRQYQDRVVNLQEKLLSAQDKRREISRHLAEIRKKSNLLQDEIHKVNRSQNVDLFLNLMKEETQVLREEHEVTRLFQECDQTERELFTAFTNAVRDSHEKQRAQLEYTKYFGIVLSIVGSFLAFFYSSLRKHDLKVFIDQKLSEGLKPMPQLSSSFLVSMDAFRDEINKMSSSLKVIEQKLSQDSRESLQLEVQDVSTAETMPSSGPTNSDSQIILQQEHIKRVLAWGGVAFVFVVLCKLVSS